MSQENVEIVRRIFDAWNAGDMDALREQYDPNVVVRWAPGWPEGSEPIMGREAVMRHWEQQREAFDSDTLEPIDFVDAGDRVVVRQTWRAVGHGPGLSMEVSAITTLRKGKTILLEFFWDHAEALEAVGLSDQDAATADSGAMSKDNVELVRDAYARFNAGERRPELWFWHEDAEYHVSRSDPDSEVRRGIDAIRSQFESWVDAYPDLTVEPIEVLGNGDQVFLWVRFAGHGASSGLPIDAELGHVYTLRDGRVARLVEYTDRAEALEAAGISE